MGRGQHAGVQNGRRFLDGLAEAAAIERDLLDRAGTTVIGRADRAGSNSLACYRAGAHLLVWGDPAVVDRVSDLSGPGTLEAVELAERAVRAGFDAVATVMSHVLPDDASVVPGGVGADYVQTWLEADDAATVPAVRAFTERCDPSEVEDADLEDLDDYAEAAINVVVPDPAPADDPLHIVAYASASVWFWDPALADIGVLVHRDHRRRGLARVVVAHTTRRLLDEGRIPLYRHEAKNVGSQSTAASVGFRPVARLDYFVASA